MNSQFARSAALLGIGISAVLASTVIPAPAFAAGFPTANCRPGFIAVGPTALALKRLCIDQFVQPLAEFAIAMDRCRDRRAYVASYGDLVYLYLNSNLDATYNPNGKWIGPDLVGDDKALCGNRNITVDGDPDQINFEGTCNKFDGRAYWCAHDRE